MLRSLSYCLSYRINNLFSRKCGVIKYWKEKKLKTNEMQPTQAQWKLGVCVLIIALVTSAATLPQQPSMAESSCRKRPAEHHRQKGKGPIWYHCSAAENQSQRKTWLLWNNLTAPFIETVLSLLLVILIGNFKLQKKERKIITQSPVFSCLNKY